MVNVALHRDDLPHLLLGGAVLCGEGFFLFGQLPTLFLEGVHLGELFAVQQVIHGGLGRPVVGQLRLVLGQILFTVPGRFVAVEHGPGLGVLHHGPHELRRAAQLPLHRPQLPGQGVGAIHRRVRLGRQFVIVSQAVLLEKLQGGGHLLDVIDLGPPLIAGALALGHTLLDVNDEVDPPRLGPGVAAPGSGRGPALQDGLDSLGAVAVPQGGAPPAGRPLKAWEPERDRAAPPVEHPDARTFQRGEEGREIGGGLGQHLVDDGPELLLLRGPLGIPQPLPVVAEGALAGQLGILNDRQLMLDAHPVREPPERPPGAEEISILPGAIQGSRIVIDVVVDVLAVCVGGNKKGVAALRPAHGRFIAHLICLLRGDLPRGKGLADLIAEHIRVPFLLPARDGFVLGLGQQELGIGGHVVALVGGDQFPALGLVRIFPVVQTVFEGLGDGFSLADVVGNQARGGRSNTSSLFRKPAASQPPVRYGTKCPKGQPVIKLCREYFNE